MEDTQEPQKKHHYVRNIIIIVVAVVVVAAAAFTYCYARGIITPANAAAKYGTFDYLDEQDVTDYIMLYKDQMGYGNVSDDEWAQFLASYDLTPDRLRLSTIQELLYEKAIDKKCSDLGITATDDEIDAMVEADKANYFSEDIWRETMEQYGQTEEGYREVCRQALLEQKLRQTVESPEPTESDIRNVIAEYASYVQESEAENAESYEEAQAILNDSDGEHLVRHSYRYVYKVSGDEATLSEREQVDLVKQEFKESGLDVDTFMVILGTYCNDQTVIAENGDMGWDADPEDYSDVYIRMLDQTSVGNVSNTFNDGDYICFIYVDQGYEVPYSEEKIDALDLDAMPESLYEYFHDCAAYELWEDASDEYLANLLNDMDVTVYPMPSDVPYNVDMSPYLVTEESEEEGATSEDSDSSASDADSTGETSSAEANDGEKSSADETSG